MIALYHCSAFYQGYPSRYDAIGIQNPSSIILGDEYTGHSGHFCTQAQITKPDD